MVTVAHGDGRIAKVEGAAYWAPRVQAKFDAFEGTLRKGLAAAIELGAALNEAKAKLPHGEFGKLFREHEEHVEHAVPFTQGWANKLMRMAANEALSDSSHGSNLPSDLHAVYELSLMSAAKVEQAIESGKIRPDMTRAEAKKLRAESDERNAVVDADGDRKARKKAEKTDFQIIEDCAQAIEEAIGTALLAGPHLREAIAARVRLIERGIRE